MSQSVILLEAVKNSGLDDKSARVYLAMLKIGQGTVSDIASDSELKRPITYVILENLARKGLVNIVLKKKVKTYQVTDPEVILARMQKNTRNFLEILPVLKGLSQEKKEASKISYFNTEEAINGIYQQINRQEKAVFITSLVRLEKCFPGSIEKWIKSYESGYNRLRSRTLVPSSSEEILMAKMFLRITNKVNIRALSLFKKCDVDIAIFGNKIALTLFEEKPLLIVIESKSVVSFFLPIFEMLWDNAKELD